MTRPEKLDAVRREVQAGRVEHPTLAGRGVWPCVVCRALVTRRDVAALVRLPGLDLAQHLCHSCLAYARKTSVPEPV